MITRLDWDSNFFAINIGQIWLTREELLNPILFLAEARNNYDLVYVYCDQMLPNDYIRSANLDLMDIMITMSTALPRMNKKSDYVVRTDLSELELKQCYEIVEQTAIVSRFYTEPMIGHEKAKALYRKWIDNSISHQFADGIIVEKNEDSICGIHIIKTIDNEKSGLCSLIGVNKKFKGHGVGKKLWQQAFSYWNDLETVTQCKVPFSIRNTESFNFHLKIGFNKVEYTKYVYHFRK